MKVIIALVVLLLSLPAFGQTICDINGDGLNFTIADLIFLINVFNSSPDNFILCDGDCNMDGDNDSVTVADLTLAIHHLYNPLDDPPYLTFNPTEDTIRIGSTETSPGDQISIPLYLNSIDTLIAYELLLKADPDYLSIDDFIPNENLDFIYSYNSTLLHLIYWSVQVMEDSIFFLPGNYHLGDLIINVNPDIVQPATTYITFGTCPEDNCYTGMANMTFFEPVLVEGEITITPTGIESGPEDNLPQAVSITAYPNPFNSLVNLNVVSPGESELVIYDLLGREVRSFAIVSGVNGLIWDSTDNSGARVNSGVYFANIKNSTYHSEKKLLYMK
ncbi:MAG: T9SS type A sorting domain-containing protein [candidate division Zixibacteria bacterium]|nr:T9SS type A sorting domain-containing protein [candidate division Zixibacteria bacterium]